mgnify:CR=1 FL=1
MKIAHLTTSLTGGAGLAASRQVQALRDSGYDVHLLTQRNSKGETSGFSKVLTAFQSYCIESKSELMTPISLCALSEEEMQEFDVIHFHAFYNMINTRFLLNIAEKRRIFITLHDERYLTGGCHQVGDCANYELNCRSCPRVHKIFRPLVEKERGQIDEMLSHPNVNLVIPSQWIKKRIDFKKLFAIDSRLKLIRNPIPEPTPNKSFRVHSHSVESAGKFVLGFVAVDLLSPWKGLDDFIGALESLDKSTLEKLYVLLIGKHGEVDISNIGCKVQIIRDAKPEIIRDLYSKMNLLVVPSKQDNSPNVIGEALYQGCKVLGSNKGGIPELLSLFNMKSIDTSDRKRFAQAIQEEIMSTEITDKGKIIKQARTIFGYKRFSEELISFYNSSSM